MNPEFQSLLDQEIDRAVRLKLIKAPALFRRKLTVTRIRGGSMAAYGGVLHDGTPIMTMPSHAYDWQPTRENDFREYASIAKDPGIGSYLCTTPGTYEQLLTQHELAHAIVWWNWVREGRPSNDRPKGHTGIWRRCYRALRADAGLVQ